MRIYDKLIESPATLGEFLKSLPVLDAPWDQAFQEKFCAGCSNENCNDCPNEEYRNNPEWWLKQETDDRENKKVKQYKHCMECFNYEPLKDGARGGKRGRCTVRHNDKRSGRSRTCKRFLEN